MSRRWLTSSSGPTAAEAAGTDTPPFSQWDIHRPAVKMAVFGNVVVMVLFFAAVVWRLFFSGKGQQEGVVDSEGAGEVDPEGAGGGGATTAPDTSTSGAVASRGGMRKVDLVALPVYIHRAPAGDGAGKAECAVCICELRDGDTGRLLPRCGHRFHAECVDRWFRSHATCPLCRAVVAGGDSSEANPRGSRE